MRSNKDREQLAGFKAVTDIIKTVLFCAVIPLCAGYVAWWYTASESLAALAIVVMAILQVAVWRWNEKAKP